MAQGFFNSGSLEVFPSAYRTQNAAGKYTSEINLTNIIKSVCDLDSFFIGENFGVIEFILDGYYFKVDANNQFNEWPDNLWFCINVPQETGLLSNYEDHTVNLDNEPSGKFTGLRWYDTEPDPAFYTAVLQVRKKPSESEPSRWINKGYIPELTDKYGNWIDLRDIIAKLFGESYYSSEGFKIDPNYIDVNEFQKYLIKNGFSVKYAGKAKQLVQANGTGEGPDSFGDPFNVGGYTRGTPSETQTIKFKDGIPVNSIRIFYGTSAPTVDGNEGDIWFVYR